MARDRVALESTWKLISLEAGGFFAQNQSGSDQEWVRSAALPLETVKGVIINSGDGVRDSEGTGNLYGRGKGSVGFLF